MPFRDGFLFTAERCSPHGIARLRSSPDAGVEGVSPRTADLVLSELGHKLAGAAGGLAGLHPRSFTAVVAVDPYATSASVGGGYGRR